MENTNIAESKSHQMNEPPRSKPIADETQKWNTVVKFAGIKLE
jgi:hypothetical protein